MPRLGAWEIGLILVIILIVFGVGKIPQVGDAIGRSVRAFRKAQSGEADQEEQTKEKTVKTAEKVETKS